MAATTSSSTCADGEVVEASRANLLSDYEAQLEGEVDVTLADGSVVSVRPLWVRLVDQLAAYTPEATQATTGVHPDTVRTIARKVATRRTRIMMGMGANKAYHSDLYQRTMNLLLALSGNWGRVGSGINCWAATQVDGQVMTGAKPVAGPEGAEMVLGMLDAVEDAVRQADPTMSDELVALELWRGGASKILGGDEPAAGRVGGGTGGMVPPAYFWYWHCGMRERWNDPVNNDPAMARSFDEYFNEALEAGWWRGLEKPGPDTPPRVLFECGGNMLRRTRGGRAILLENLWPKLDKIVTIDWRWSITALHSDIVLPAAQHYEKVGTHIPIMAMIFSDKAAEPIGEARPEWEMFADLCLAMARRAEARGLEGWTDANGVAHRYDGLWDRYTLGGVMTTEEQHIDETLRDSAYAEVLPPDASLEKVREKGFIRYTNWGRFGMAKGQATPWPEPNHPLNVFSNHVERGEPYPTLTRRAQFLIEHPWFVEAGEDLPVHKDAPTMGGDRPFRLTTGHNRWSIHAMNQANPAILGTHRGEPHIVIHPDDAADNGIADNQPVRCFNDVGSFVVNAKLSPGPAPRRRDRLQRLGDLPVQGLDRPQRGGALHGQVPGLRRGLRPPALRPDGVAARPHRPLRLRGHRTGLKGPLLARPGRGGFQGGAGVEAGTGLPGGQIRVGTGPSPEGVGWVLVVVLARHGGE